MDYSSPQNCITFNLQKAARTMARRMEAVLAPFDLTAQQFSAMVILHNGGALATTRLAELTGTERTTITRNLKLLRKRGLVEAAYEIDRRINAVQLTDAGRSILSDAYPAWHKVQSAAVAQIGKKKASDPASLLSILIGI